MTLTQNIRKHGRGPYRVVVIHGGPGAGGEMAQVAEELATDVGIIEPIQTALSVNGLVEELKKTIADYVKYPAILIGFSWGAWLGYMLASKYPELVRKLILVGSGPFVEKYAENIYRTRLSRLNNLDKSELTALFELLDISSDKDELDNIFRRIGEIITMADTYRRVTPKPENLKSEVNPIVYQKVWKEAAELRKSGNLLKIGREIRCPVVGIHGDYDPHPYQGVSDTLPSVLKHFKFKLLKNCGHKPWIEEEAHKEFYSILRQELSEDAEI